MNFSIRPWNHPGDYERLAELYTQFESEPVTAAKLAEWQDKRPKETIIQQLVAVDETGHIVGFATTGHSTWMAPGKFWVNTQVDTAWRNRTVGAALFNAIVQFAQENGLTKFVTEVRDNDALSHAFATKRGFTLDRHRFESTLDLPTFDESRFAGVVEGVEESGIRFITRVDGFSPELEQKVYEFCVASTRDIPGNDDVGFPAFEQWRKWWLEGDDLPLDCFIVALDGDQVAGATTMELVEGTGALYTDYTGVSKEYRGRKIALALKLLAVKAAKGHGAPYMRTNNDSKNAPMLAVNRKMGYISSPGLYVLEKQL